jgi:4-diphosphocytidyl-2-C-methyl-D-erythritol kinase
MIVFPNAKINLGLYIKNKRKDGFHDIETVFYPLQWADALEVIISNGKELFEFSSSGLTVEGEKKSNTIYKAWKLVSKYKELPPLKVHLHKNIPMGAGLGGGSSDGAHFIRLVNEQLGLRFSTGEMSDLAKQLGSDCAFFIANKPVFATGKGDRFRRISIDLSQYYFLVVYPGIHSDTKAAYEGAQPGGANPQIRSVICESPVHEWKNLLFNEFETGIFRKYPQIESLKKELYRKGALYASLSGSGSSVYGIFEYAPDVTLPENYSAYVEKPRVKKL